MVGRKEFYEEFAFVSWQCLVVKEWTGPVYQIPLFLLVSYGYLDIILSAHGESNHNSSP